MYSNWFVFEPKLLLFLSILDLVTVPTWSFEDIWSIHKSIHYSTIFHTIPHYSHVLPPIPPIPQTGGTVAPRQVVFRKACTSLNHVVDLHKPGWFGGLDAQTMMQHDFKIFQKGWKMTQNTSHHHQQRLFWQNFPAWNVFWMGSQGTRQTRDRALSSLLPRLAKVTSLKVCISLLASEYVEGTDKFCIRYVMVCIRNEIIKHNNFS